MKRFFPLLCIGLLMVSCGINPGTTDPNTPEVIPVAPLPPAPEAVSVPTQKENLLESAIRASIESLPGTTQKLTEWPKKSLVDTVAWGKKEVIETTGLAKNYSDYVSIVSPGIECAKTEADIAPGFYLCSDKRYKDLVQAKARMLAAFENNNLTEAAKQARILGGDGSLEPRAIVRDGLVMLSVFSPQDVGAPFIIFYGYVPKNETGDPTHRVLLRQTFAPVSSEFQKDWETAVMKHFGYTTNEMIYKNFNIKVLADITEQLLKTLPLEKKTYIRDAQGDFYETLKETPLFIQKKDSQTLIVDGKVLPEFLPLYGFQNIVHSFIVRYGMFYKVFPEDSSVFLVSSLPQNDTSVMLEPTKVINKYFVQHDGSVYLCTKFTTTTPPVQSDYFCLNVSADIPTFSCQTPDTLGKIICEDKDFIYTSLGEKFHK